MRSIGKERNKMTKIYDEFKENQKKQPTVSDPVEQVVMTKADHYANTLAEHIDNNAEAQKRFMLLIADATPSISHLVMDLINEWHSINKIINDEFKQKLKDDFSS
jgi:ribosomal protein S15P/S13E